MKNKNKKILAIILILVILILGGASIYIATQLSTRETVAPTAPESKPAASEPDSLWEGSDACVVDAVAKEGCSYKYYCLTDSYTCVATNGLYTKTTPYTWCDGPIAPPPTCEENLKTYDTGPNTGMCYATQDSCDAACIKPVITKAPTEAPTAAPTAVPTIIVTVAPTAAPTVIVTAATAVPTTVVTVAAPTALPEAGIFDLPGIAAFAGGLILAVVGILLAL
jgi:hypothetical protein